MKSQLNRLFIKILFFTSTFSPFQSNYSDDDCWTFGQQADSRPWSRNLILFFTRKLFTIYSLLLFSTSDPQYRVHCKLAPISYMHWLSPLTHSEFWSWILPLRHRACLEMNPRIHCAKHKTLWSSGKIEVWTINGEHHNWLTPNSSDIPALLLPPGQGER